MNSQPKKKESPLVNLAVNILIPSLILMKLSGEDRLGSVNALLLALAFPIGYGIYDFLKEKKVNFFSILGLVSVLITGVVGLLKLDPHWIAVKEAAVPLLIGVAILVSVKTPFPLVKKLLYNEQLIDVEKVDQALDAHQNRSLFDKRMNGATYMLAGSFLISAILNYSLAKFIVKSPAGTEAFNQELGQMQAWSFPVIALPTTIITLGILWYLINEIKKMTHLELKDIFRELE